MKEFQTIKLFCIQIMFIWIWIFDFNYLIPHNQFQPQTLFKFLEVLHVSGFINHQVLQTESQGSRWAIKKSLSVTHFHHRQLYSHFYCPTTTICFSTITTASDTPQFPDQIKLGRKCVAVWIAKHKKLNKKLLKKLSVVTKQKLC